MENVIEITVNRPPVGLLSFPVAVCFIGLLVVLLLWQVPSRLFKTRRSRIAVLSMISVAVVFIAVIVLDQYAILNARICRKFMTRPGPFIVKDNKGILVQVRADNTAYCRCHGTREELDRYLEGKTGSWISGNVLKLTDWFLGKTVTRPKGPSKPFIVEGDPAPSAK